jgi:hypothetical protein
LYFHIIQQPQIGEWIGYKLLTPKFGKEYDWWVQFEKEFVWWKERYF